MTQHQRLHVQLTADEHHLLKLIRHDIQSRDPSGPTVNISDAVRVMMREYASLHSVNVQQATATANA